MTINCNFLKQFTVNTCKYSVQNISFRHITSSVGLKPGIRHITTWANVKLSLTIHKSKLDLLVCHLLK